MRLGPFEIRCELGDRYEVWWWTGDTRSFGRGFHYSPRYGRFTAHRKGRQAARCSGVRKVMLVNQTNGRIIQIYDNP